MDKGEKREPKRKYITYNNDLYKVINVRNVNIQESLIPYNNTYTHYEDRENWSNLITILDTDELFHEWSRQAKAYIALIYVTRAKSINTYNKYKPIKNRLKNSERIEAMYNKYTKYEPSNDIQTFQDLFIKPEHDYILDNKKANSCFVTLIIDTYKNQFEKTRCEGGKKYINESLDYDYLTNLIGIENLDSDIGLSIEQSIAFFSKFNLGLEVLNVYNKVIYQYHPEKYNKNIFPNTLRMIMYNNHCIKLDNDINSLCQKNNRLTEEINLTVNDRYHITQFLDEQTTAIKQLSDVTNEIKKIQELQNDDDKSEIKIKFICNDLNNILDEMIQQKYMPNVQYFNNKLSSLGFTTGKFYVNIDCTDDSIEYSNGVVDETRKDEFKEYQTQYQKLYTSIINNSYISHYNDKVVEIETTYRMGPIVGYIQNIDENETFNAIDTQKAYTYFMSQIHEIPVFSYFDTYEPYDGHTIEKLTKYIIKCDGEDILSKLLSKSTYSRHYGFTLSEFQGVNYEIISYCKPSKIIDISTTYGDAILNLYKSDLTDTQKKFMVNKITGLLEKQRNIKYYSKIFLDEEEGKHYANKYNGDINYISIYEHTDNNFIQEPIREYMVVSMKAKRLLSEGFLSIKEIIYSKALVDLKHTYDKIKNIVDIVGFNTDSVLYRGQNYVLKPFFNFDYGIGNKRFECNKICNTKLDKNVNEKPEIKAHYVNKYSIDDEFNIDMMNVELNKYNCNLILGLCPGVGKTTSVKNYSKDTLFITPYNTLAQDLINSGYKAITLNNLLGIYADGQKYKDTHGFDTSNYSSICFDEVFLYNIPELVLIDKYIRNNAEKKYFGTGDPSQLPPINMNNILNQKEYLTKCIEKIFPNVLLLKTNKRLNNQKDRDILTNLKNDILDTNIPIMNTFRKYKIKMINKIRDINTTKGISYFNFRANYINKFIHEKTQYTTEYTTISGVKYYIGMSVTCKKHTKLGGKKLFTNYTYKIKGFTSKSLIIIDELSKDEFEIINGMVYKTLKLSYISTCHSVQGTTINQPITIFDCNISHVSRTYVWTAITRVRTLDDLTIYEHSNDEVNRLSESKLRLYLNMKIQNYVTQDNNGGRTISKDYITCDWISEQLNKCDKCPCCKEIFELYNDDGETISNITVDRIDSNLDHNIKNCRLLCKTCNATKSNRYVFPSSDESITIKKRSNFKYSNISLCFEQD